MVTKEKRETC